MSDWSTSISNQKLSDVYERFTMSIDDAMDMYLAELALDLHTTIGRVSGSTIIYASHDFNESATKKTSVANIVEWRKTGRLRNLFARTAILLMIEAFDIALQRANMLAIKENVATDSVHKNEPVVIQHARQVGKLHGLKGPLPMNDDAMSKLAGLLRLRDTVMLNGTVVPSDFAGQLYGKWNAVTANQPLVFDGNSVDDVHYFLAMHMRGYISELDKTLHP